MITENILSGNSANRTLKKKIALRLSGLWNAWVCFFSGEMSSVEEEEKIDKIMAKIMEDGLLTGKRQFITCNPEIGSGSAGHPEYH